MNYRYRIALRPLSAAEGSGWLAEVPELPGCMSDGETPQEAVENVMDAIACWIEATVSSPDFVEADPHYSDRTRSFKAIAEFGGRMLRVVHRAEGDDIVVITVHFDRGARR